MVLCETVIVLARRTRVVPGEWTHRKSKKPASSRSSVYNTWQTDATSSYYSYITRGMALAARLCQSEAAEGRQSHAAESWRGTDATSTTPTCVSWLLMQHADAGGRCADVFLRQTRSVSGNIDRTLGSGACHRTTRTRLNTPHAHGVDWLPSHGWPRTRSTHTRSSCSRTRSPSERSLLNQNLSTHISHRSSLFASIFFLLTKRCGMGFRMLFQPRLLSEIVDSMWVKILCVIIWTSQAFRYVSSVVYQLEFSKQLISETV